MDIGLASSFDWGLLSYFADFQVQYGIS